MGVDKSSLLIQGEPLGHRLARLLREGGWEPCILGRQEIPSFQFQADDREFDGPLAALRGFTPPTEFTFILSCDVPLFTPEIPGRFLAEIGDFDAVIPVVEGRAQPLCALYRSRAWARLLEIDSRRVFDWIEELNVRTLDADELARIGIDSRTLRGANTREDFEALLD